MNITHKDFLGDEIQVSDIVVYANGSYANLSTGMVTKRNPVMVTINGNSVVHPGQCMIITNKYMNEKPRSYAKMLEDYKGDFSKDDAKPKEVMRYRVCIKTQLNSGRVSLVCNVLANGHPDKSINELGTFGSGPAMRITRKLIGWNGSVTDDLRISVRSYSENAKSTELPAKLMKKFFNTIPSHTTILQTFDDMAECKMYLNLKGVDVNG